MQGTSPGAESETRPCLLTGPRLSDVLATVGTQDVITLCEEAASHQRKGAFLAVKAVVVPLPVLKADVLGATESTDGMGAPCTLLGMQDAEAVEAVGGIIPGCEALT